MGIEGKVDISFTVDESGKLIDLKVEQGLGHDCDEAAMEVFLKTDLKWMSGAKDGVRVKVKMYLPFTFRLR